MIQHRARSVVGRLLFAVMLSQLGCGTSSETATSPTAPPDPRPADVAPARADDKPPPAAPEPPPPAVELAQPAADAPAAAETARSTPAAPEKVEATASKPSAKPGPRHERLGAGPAKNAASGAPAPATPAAVESAPAAPPAGRPASALASYRVEPSGRVTFLIDAPLEKIKGACSRLGGQFAFDPAALQRARGEVTLDLATLKTETFPNAGQNKQQTGHALNWMEIGSEVPAATRERNRMATFRIDEVLRAEPGALGPGVARASVVLTGTLTLHGVASKHEVQVELIAEGDPAAPSAMRVVSKKPLTLSGLAPELSPLARRLCPPRRVDAAGVGTASQRHRRIVAGGARGAGQRAARVIPLSAERTALRAARAAHAGDRAVVRASAVDDHRRRDVGGLQRLRRGDARPARFDRDAGRGWHRIRVRLGRGLVSRPRRARAPPERRATARGERLAGARRPVAGRRR